MLCTDQYLISDFHTIAFTFPHHTYIPVWLFSKNTSLEFRQAARAGTSMVLVLDGSEPWTWNNLIGGSGSLEPFLDVPPWWKKITAFIVFYYVMFIVHLNTQQSNIHTSKITILPLKIVMKCLGSFPIVILTWTGSPPYLSSKATAWNAEAANSSWVACRPWNINAV